MTVTAEYTVRLERPTPSDAPVHLRARIAEAGERKVVVEAELMSRGQAHRHLLRDRSWPSGRIIPRTGRGSVRGHGVPEAAARAALSRVVRPRVVHTFVHTLVHCALVCAWVRVSTAPLGAQTPVFDVVEASIPELQAALESGRVTSVDLVNAYLARVAAYDRAGPMLNAIVRVHPGARAEAQRLDRERAEGRVRGPLHGIPILLKDNYATFDMPTTGSTLALAGWVPPDDAFQVRKLREAGAVILAKTNMHELAAGITSISSLGGQPRNPYDPARNPGGSSGGTGAAVAASFGAVGWGSDTCGSIRIPSSVHNLVGLRPTKGLSSIDGIIPLSHTQDTGGPLARSAVDLAIALDATIGADAADPATEAMRDREPIGFRASLDAGALDGARIGALTEWLGEGADAPVTDVVRAALDAMAAAGRRSSMWRFPTRTRCSRARASSGSNSPWTSPTILPPRAARRWRRSGRS